MKKVLESIKNKIASAVIEAHAYRENTMVISEYELKAILETAEKDNDWIPVTQKLPEVEKNVRVTAVMNAGKIATGMGWYNRFMKRWKVCFDEDDAFYWGEVLAWKEIIDEPYQAKDLEKGPAMTNAERIRSMTDEELAALLACPYDTAGNPVNIMPCITDPELQGFATPEYCKTCMMKWLNREVVPE